MFIVDCAQFIVGRRRNCTSVLWITVDKKNSTVLWKLCITKIVRITVVHCSKPVEQRLNMNYSINTALCWFRLWSGPSKLIPTFLSQGSTTKLAPGIKWKKPFQVKEWIQLSNSLSKTAALEDNIRGWKWWNGKGVRLDQIQKGLASWPLLAACLRHAHQHPPKTNIGTNAAQNHPQICHYWKPSEQIVHGSILCRFNCIHDAKEETLDIQTWLLCVAIGNDPRSKHARIFLSLTKHRIN